MEWSRCLDSPSVSMLWHILILRSTSRYRITAVTTITTRVTTCHFSTVLHRSYILKIDLHRSWEALQPLWHWADPWRSCWGTSDVVIFWWRFLNVWTSLMIDTHWYILYILMLQPFSTHVRWFQVISSRFGVLSESLLSELLVQTCLMVDIII